MFATLAFIRYAARLCEHALRAARAKSIVSPESPQDTCHEQYQRHHCCGDQKTDRLWGRLDRFRKLERAGDLRRSGVDGRQTCDHAGKDTEPCDPSQRPRRTIRCFVPPAKLRLKQDPLRGGRVGLAASLASFGSDRTCNRYKRLARRTAFNVQQPVAVVDKDRELKSTIRQWDRTGWIRKTGRIQNRAGMGRRSARSSN